jgi:hypothetical protein
MITRDPEVAALIDEVISMAPPPPALPSVETSARRSPRRAALVLAAVVAVGVVAAVLIVAPWSHDSRRPTILAPSRSKAVPGAVPLTSQGPANCAPYTADGGTIRVAATVNGGHVICVTEKDGLATTYFDGIEVQKASVRGPTEWEFAGFGQIGKRLMYFGYLPAYADEGEATFCNGTRVRLQPLNDSSPRYVGVLAYRQLGAPNNIGPATDGRAATPGASCPRT